MGNRGKAAFASPNEIAPAIGGCLLAFDVRLVKCTGCDPPFEENPRLLPLQVPGLFRGPRILHWLAMRRRSQRSEQQACSIITLPPRSLARSSTMHIPYNYVNYLYTTIPVILVQIGVV